MGKVFLFIAAVMCAASINFVQADPVIPRETDGYLHYDDGVLYATMINTKFWGVEFQAGAFEGVLTEVMVYTEDAAKYEGGTLTMHISSSTGSITTRTDRYHQVIEPNENKGWQYISLETPLQFAENENCWILLEYSGNATSIATVSRNTEFVGVNWRIFDDAWVNVDITAFMIRALFASAQNLEANDITTTSARLTWEGNAERYDILYKTGINGFHMDFEDGLGDWTTIDADGDGYNWYWTEGESQIHHEGLGSAGSASYFDDQVGALTPDNYLVSPLMDLGGVFSFWASESNSEGYNAEHFGVAVSTTGNTDAADFTMIPGAEWTLDDNRVWHQYKADLSAYEGQRGYVAIRHFECTNQFRLIVDDIELTPDHIIRNVSGTEYTLTDLLPETNYDVTVAPHGAIDEGGSIIIPSEYLATTSFTTLPGPIDPTVETDGWVYYDTGIKAANIGIGDNLIYWGIMIPGGTVEATHLTKVSAYAPRYGDLTVYIYQGGETPAEGALLHQQDISWEDIDSFQEAKMTPVVTIDPSQDLWIVLGNTGHINQPAVYCNIENAHHARWICTSDATGNYAWHNMQELYPYHCQLAWMIRGLFSSETGIEEIVESRKTKDRCAQRQKLLIDGELYILRDGKIFNAQGARVK